MSSAALSWNCTFQLCPQHDFLHILKYGIPGSVLCNLLNKIMSKIAWVILFIVYNMLKDKKKNIGCLYYTAMLFLLLSK